MKTNYLIIGGTGKTGRKVVSNLKKQGYNVRIGSRSSNPSFEWEDPSNWSDVLEGIDRMYIVFYPDLAVPGAYEAIERLIDVAKTAGVRKAVLLSGKGEKEAERCEKLISNSGMDYTLVRASWFNQNFSESFFLDPVISGEVALPMPDAEIPFVDTGDIADVVTEALTDNKHNGQTYEITGPRKLSFAEVVEEISKATGRPITYRPVTLKEYREGLRMAGVPADYIWLFEYLFEEVLGNQDNQVISNDIERVLGRKAKDFSEFAKSTAESGVWDSKVTPTHMDPETSIRTFIEEAFNNGNLSILDDIIHPGYKFSSPESRMDGISQLKEFIQSLRTVFPDLKLCINDIFASDDRTCTSFTLTGTHEENFMGIPPTKKAVEVRGVVISKFQDNKISEEWEILDNLGFFQQLGVVPSLS